MSTSKLQISTETQFATDSATRSDGLQVAEERADAEDAGGETGAAVSPSPHCGIDWQYLNRFGWSKRVWLVGRPGQLVEATLVTMYLDHFVYQRSLNILNFDLNSCYFDAGSPSCSCTAAACWWPAPWLRRPPCADPTSTNSCSATITVCFTFVWGLSYGF